MAVDHLWNRYWEGDPGARDELMVSYLPLVRYVASTIGVPAHVDHADLEAYGVFGLADAIERFRPELGFKFETYGVRRIRGAILDHLRSLDWVPRTVRSSARKIDRAMAELEAQLHREPTAAEVAEHLGLTEEELHAQLSLVANSNQGSLDESSATLEGERASLGDQLGDASVEDQAFAAALESQVRSAVLACLPRLEERDRMIIALHYLEDVTLGGIAEILEVTESRACQMVAKANLAMRRELLELAHT